MRSDHGGGTLKRSTSNFSESQRSDTDSGRSSDVDNRKFHINNGHLYAPQPTSKHQVKTLPRHVSDLKVRRERPVQKFNSLPRPSQLTSDNARPEVVSGSRKHPVVRRIAEAARKREFRRNTIDVTVKDLEMAEAVLNEGKLQTKNLSKSTNHIDRIGSGQDSFEQKIDAFSFDNNKNGLSLPDLSVQRLYVLPTTALKVRRHRSVREDVNQIMPPHSSGDVQICRGPEFIANAALPARQIDISDAKVRFTTQSRPSTLNTWV